MNFSFSSLGCKFKLKFKLQSFELTRFYCICIKDVDMYYKGGKETTSTCAKVPEGTVGKIRKDL
jgi:hypothetical protein